MSSLEARHAGMSPKTMTARSETNPVKARMRMSGWTSKCMAEVERDSMFATALLPQKATTAAKPPPPAASNTLSVSSWRRTRARPAPSASRTAISLWRELQRTSNRFATFVQAIRRSIPTTTIRNARGFENWKGHFLPNHLFHVPTKCVRRAPHDRHRAMDFMRVLLVHHHLFEWGSVVQHRAEILVQPHNQILFARRFRKLLKPAECIVQRLAACYHRMDEHALTFLSQILERIILQYVVPQRNESGRARIHNERAVLCQESFHKQIEFTLVYAALFQKVQLAHRQSAVLSQRMVDRVRVNGKYILPLCRQILRQDGGYQAFSNTTFALQRNVDRRRAVPVTVCSCHLSPPFHAPTHSNSLQPANENQAGFLPIALGLPAGRALRFFALPFPADPVPQKVWAVFPRCLSRLVFSLFCCAILSCENCDSSSVGLPLAGLPRWLSVACLSSVPLLFQEEEIESAQILFRAPLRLVCPDSADSLFSLTGLLYCCTYSTISRG